MLNNFVKTPHKAKTWSKLFMALALLLVATTTFNSEDSEAAKRPVAVRKAPVKRKAAPKKRSRKVSVNNSSTPAGVFALYQNSTFGYAKCLPATQEPTANILKRNGINTSGAAENERTALAKGIAQVERLLGKPIPVDYRYNYQWVEAGGAWNSGISRAGYVTVKRFKGSPKGTLTGRMMHELGHRFGHANAGENYSDYQKHIRGKRCKITTYCGKSINEEFAEVFEAYVVNPDFLAKYCPDSYSYFKTVLFRNPENLLASCEDPNSILGKGDHIGEDDDDAIEDTGEDQIDENKDYIVTLPDQGPIPMSAQRDENGNGVVTPSTDATTPAIPSTDSPAGAATTTDTSVAPTTEPTVAPTATPTAAPTVAPSVAPTAVPTVVPADGQWSIYLPAPGTKIPVPTARPKK